MAETVHVTSDARAVANYFLARARVEGVPLDNLKLMKLVYISHGWTLGVTGQPLCTQPPVAWPYGPVFRDVYFAFRDAGYNPIRSAAQYYDYEAGRPVDYVPSFSPAQKEIVDLVWDRYKQYSGLQLSALTHESDTPWFAVTRGKDRGQIKDMPMPNDLIANYYRELGAKNAERYRNAS